MTRLNSNTPAPLRTAGMPRELDAAGFDDLAARQARLAEAMRETFFRQLKFFNTMMVDLPLGWLRADPQQVQVQSALPKAMPGGIVDVATVDGAGGEATRIAEILATEILATEILAAEVADTQVLPATRKPKKPRAPRKKPAPKASR